MFWLQEAFRLYIVHVYGLFYVLFICSLFRLWVWAFMFEIEGPNFRFCLEDLNLGRCFPSQLSDVRWWSNIIWFAICRSFLLISQESTPHINITGRGERMCEVWLPGGGSLRCPREDRELVCETGGPSGYERTDHARLGWCWRRRPVEGP